jgi:hypothetical protein
MRHAHDSDRHIPLVLLGVLLALTLALIVSASLGAAVASAAAPTVSIDPSPTASYTTAHVSGTVDPKGNETYYSFEYSTDGVTWSGFAVETPFAAVVPASSGSTHVSGELSGLAPGTPYFVRLAAVDFLDSFPETSEILSAEPNPTFTTLAVALPSVSLGAPSSVTGTSAHFSGQINPGAPAGNPATFEVSWGFECNPECPGMPSGTIPADNTSHTVEADATGLLYNTSYEVKLIVSNAGGETSAAQTFKTDAVAPQVESRPVGTATDTTAVIGGSVAPNGSPTTYTIQYANNPSFTGATSVLATTGASAGSGQTPVVVSQLITGLEPNSTYYFRITAENPIEAVVSAPQSFHTRGVAEAAQGCSNEQLRAENNSLELPDCRAYELVSTDFNHAALLGYYGASENGETIVSDTADAPDHASSGQALFNYIRSTRDPTMGWSGVSLSPPLPAPVTAYTSVSTMGVAEDLSATFESADQPLSGGVVSNGKNLFVRRPDGTYRLVTDVGTPIGAGFNAYQTASFYGGTPDFSHVYFQPVLAQLPSDPLAGTNTYSWSEETGLRLVGILPNGTPAPGGATLPGGILRPFSEDGKYVAFTAEGQLYLRFDESQTVQVDQSQRTAPDPNPPAGPGEAGITVDGSTVLFTSRSELTNDANTGESAGVATDAGNDIYSYDVATGRLDDLTVDTNPADVATGANVQHVITATSDGSYIYFTATGKLAAGAVPGQTSLYVWHEGNIDFVADAGGLLYPNRLTYMTPSGQHVAFTSTESLTGYDNTDPVTGQAHVEVFEYAYGGGLVCVSCRADGARPTADSTLNGGRVVSEDGSRVFFESSEALVPQASNGLQKVFEYSGGTVSLVSSPDSSSNATFFDASATGDNVFFSTYDELVPNPNGGDDAVYDARIGGGFPVDSRKGCSGVGCQGDQLAAPGFEQPGSLKLNLANPTTPAAKSVVKTKSKPLTRAQKLAKALRACRAKHNKKQRSACEKKARRVYGRSK